MKEKDKKWIIDRYNKRLAEHGANINALASGLEERRLIRFNVLKEVGIQPKDAILDLGCGFGDLFSFFLNDGLKIDYSGYDINPKLIDEAIKLHPAAKFEVKDILNENYPEFDYIVSTSSFNLPLKHEDNYFFIEKILKSCYDHARKGVAIDFLTSYVDFPSKDGFHYDPEKIFIIAKGITKRVCLRHDYPLFEFCVYLYKDFKGWGK